MEHFVNSPSLPQFNILVVDDNTTVLSTLEELLNAQGYHAITKSNANSALSFLLLGQPKIDLIISDIKMPEQDGFDFYSQVQALDNHENLPFIFLSSLNSGTEIRKAKEFGIDDFITKPFLPADLLASIKGKLQKAWKNKLYLEDQISANKHYLLQTISHEFRTPLVLINNGTELLKEKLRNDNLAELITTIEHGGKKLSNLIEDLLTIQQLKLGFNPLPDQILKTTKQVIFSRLVQNAIDSFLEDYSEYCNEAAPYINFNSLLLQNVKINVSPKYLINALQRILSNAHKFNQKGCDIDVMLKKEDQLIYCCIRDYGAGFPDGSFAEACKELSQLNRKKLEQQGGGLGLSIAEHYIRLNQGILTYEKPEDGIGSIIKVGFVVN
ncbi:MAG: response regulator [Deltaproteobacteria bacterium]|jgi:signal transduction histidine kinase|nr:response regulator [Deltaproteobacteria bacterium]